MDNRQNSIGTSFHFAPTNESVDELWWKQAARKSVGEGVQIIVPFIILDSVFVNSLLNPEYADLGLEPLRDELNGESRLC